MLRRFNYTGRKKLSREDIHIALTGAKPIWAFDADLSKLSDYQLPPDARVFVEAYEQAAYMRFDFGTVGSLIAPEAPARVLTEFEGSDNVHFRVKVVDPSAEAKLLAEADGILPLSQEEEDQKKLPLLPVRHQDLGQELWRIEFPEDTQSVPTLLVNVQIADRTAFVRAPAFMSLAWPSILREILTRVLKVENISSFDENDDWMGRWLQFARSLVPGLAAPKNPDTADEWISSVVSAFAQKFTLLSKFQQEEKEDANGAS